MVAFSDLTQVMQNARTDAKTIDEYVHGAADTQVTSRLGKRYWTLATLDNKLSLVKIKAEKTLADIDTLAKSATDSITAKSNSANTTIDNKATQANSDIAAKVANANTAIDTKVASIDTRADSEIANLQSAINTAAAAGAGANGWDDMLIAVSENVNQRQINDGLDSIAQLAGINNPRNGQRVYVKSVSANYIYNSNLTAAPNGVTIVDKWEMELQDYYYASWFCTGSTPTIPKHNEFNVGYAYATSKGKPFIVDTNVYVDGTPRTDGITYAVKVLSNSQLLFTPKGKLTQIAVDNANYSILNCFGADNFYIFQAVLDGDKLTATNTNTNGEWGYGLSVTSCTNGLIEYPTMINCRGDGLYIGQEYFNHSAASLCPKDIKIIKPKIINAGRNGIALCCGENIYIDTPYVDGVSGKAPEAAIDLEPEEADDSPLKSYLKNVVVHNATLLNAKIYGVLHWFTGAERNVDVKFTGRTVIAGGVYLVRMGSADIKDDKPCVRVGQVYYEHLIHDQRLVDDGVQSDANIEISTAGRGRGIRTVVNHLELHNTRNGYAPSILFGGISQYSGDFIVNRLSTYSYKGANNYPNFLRTLDTTTTLENIKIPIADSKEISRFDDKRTYYCGDNVDIGGYQKITANLVNSDALLANTVLFTPQNDGSGNIYTKVMTAPNKGRKLTYKFNPDASAGSALQTVTPFLNLDYVSASDKFAFITVDNTKDTPQVTASFGKWINGSTTVMQ